METWVQVEEEYPMLEILKKAQGLSLEPVIGLIGGDPLLRQRIREILIARALPKNLAGMNLSRFQVGETPMADILAASRDFPCLAEHRVVILTQLGKLKKKEAPAWAAYLKSPPATTCLIAEAEKLDGRLEWVKIFKKQASLWELPQVQRDEALEWIREGFRNEKKKWGEGVCEQILEWVGRDLGILEQAVIQLALWTGDRPEVTLRDVESLLKPISEENIFEVIDALFSSQPARKFKRLNRLLESGEPPLKILSLIYRHVSILLSLDFRIFPMPPMARRRYTEQARRLASRLHPGLLATLCRADRALKGSPLSPGLVLKKHVEELSGFLAEGGHQPGKP